MIVRAVAGFLLVLSLNGAAAATLTGSEVSPAGAAVVTTGASSLTLNKNFTSLDPIDITFHVVSESNVRSSYRITDAVANNTGFDWTDFHFQVLFPGGGTKFVDTPAPTSSRGGSFVFRPDPESFLPDTTIVDWFGNVPAGQMVTFTLTLDVNYNPFTDYDFVLRERPTVPEPGTASLLGTAVLLISARLGRRAK